MSVRIILEVTTKAQNHPFDALILHDTKLSDVRLPMLTLTEDHSNDCYLLVRPILLHLIVF